MADPAAAEAQVDLLHTAHGSSGRRMHIPVMTHALTGRCQVREMPGQRDDLPSWDLELLAPTPVGPAAELRARSDY